MLKTHQAAVNLARAQGIVRGRDLAKVGASGATLQRLLQEGILVRVNRGLYVAPYRGKVGEPDQLAQLTIRYPNAVFCLLTALQIHGITTQSPHEVWIAISHKARAPSINYPPLRIMRFSDPTLDVVQVCIDGVIHIPVTSIAKTIADCFKFRNKIGLDVALEALRDAWQKQKVTMDELWAAAGDCRVANVMRPYLESLV
ncbi:MAG: transcriptional regulator [Burkholderiaceae bacterium]|nr:transcriptional regulator [Burkholderiaceae bacterium]